MAAVRRKDTKAEVAVRKVLWARGYRYRVDYSGVPGRPDIAFPRIKLAVFIDGDFWHGNAWKLRGLDSLAELFPTRTEWWVKKITRNMQRDEEVNRQLDDSGWSVVRFWESDVNDQVDEVVEEIILRIENARG